MNYKTKHRNYRIETSELEDGSIDVSVVKPNFLGICEKRATTTTKTFENHTQATKYAKDAIDKGEIPF
ncbi:MAG: hypothetical protein QNJ47_12595 [Nostocaceae cyanobacterium]|nr:hypothetical protein [Nostocaceae cyanobacterium]